MTVTQFESLLKTHGSAILGFCRHLTGDEVSAQDLYQDTLLKAFSKLAKINCDTTEEMLSAKNYLIGIAVRLYQNQKRRKMNYEASFTDDVEDMLYAEENVIDETEQKELHIAVRQAVDGLPEKLRIVTFMFYYADTNDDTDAQTKLDLLKNSPDLANVSAVKNDRIVIVPLFSINPGLQNADFVEKLAKELHSEAFE